MDRQLLRHNVPLKLDAQHAIRSAGCNSLGHARQEQKNRDKLLIYVGLENEKEYKKFSLNESLINAVSNFFELLQFEYRAKLKMKASSFNLNYEAKVK